VKKYRMLAIGVLALLLIPLLGLRQQGYAQSVDEYDITLETMGYEDVTISGPRSGTSYYFSLPANWEVVGDSYLNLLLEYRVILPEAAAYPQAMLEVQLNGHTLHVEELSSPTPLLLRVVLPASDFRLSEDTRPNSIQILLSESSHCESDIRTSLTVENASVLHLVYGERPLPLGLALFPKPIYQRWSFEPGYVRFVLPDEFDETDVRAAAIIAARLGQLTSHRLPISATLASEQAVYDGPGEHLIVVGRPDRNPVIGQLGLPVPLAERRLVLRSQMPQAVSPGSVLSYTLFVENTISDTQSLVVEDRFSPVDARFLECGASCQQIASGTVRWEVGALEAGQSASTTVTLQVAPVISPDVLVRHTATLFDSSGRILNVDTLAAQTSERPDSHPLVSPQQKSTEFFVRESQAVPEDAGVLQEIVSPWSARHVAIIVTGLNDEALLKAARGLNPWNRFPGVGGETAIVKDVRPFSVAGSVPPRDVTFASLGYGNVELSVPDLGASDYNFDFPPGATLGEDSYLALHLAHAAILSSIGGGVKVTLNGVPIGSANLDDSNLSNAWLQIPLSRTAIRPGLNRIRIQASMSHVDRCLMNKNNAYWLGVYADSFLHFEYRPIQATFSLDELPYPLNWLGNLGDVLFSLSDTPSLAEIEGLLHIASMLGSGSDGKELVPRVMFGGGTDQTALSGTHVVAIGLPTRNPVIRRANAQLPQPFMPDSNEIYQSIDGPIYGIPPETDLGFVQELVSPWDREGNHAFVVATGTTDKGVHWATSALSQRPNPLRGDLAMVRGEEIYNADTRPVVAEEVFSMTVSLTPIPTETPTPQGVLEESSQTPTPQQVSGQAVSSFVLTREPSPPVTTHSTRPKWMSALLVVSVLTVVGSVAWAVRKARLS
jgi:hypothetical protein